MTRNEKIKEILYDLDRAKGDYDKLEDLLLGFTGKTPGYRMVAEFQVSVEDDVDAQEKFEKEMFKMLEDIEDTDDEPDLMRITFFKQD